MVDGASTDGSVELLTAALNDPVDVLISEPDRSEAHAFNKGMLAARGELIKFVTDDDAFFRDGLELAFQVMLEHPEIDVLNTGGEICNVDGQIIGFQSAQPTTNPYWRLGCGVGLILRRKSLALTGLMDVRHRWADTSFLIQMIQRDVNLKFLQVKTFRYQPHAASTSKSNQALQKHELSAILRDQGVDWRYRVWPMKDALRAIREPLELPRRLVKRIRPTSKPLREPEWNGQLY